MTPSHGLWHLLLLLTSPVTSSQKGSSSGATTLNLGGTEPSRTLHAKEEVSMGPKLL